MSLTMNSDRLHIKPQKGTQTSRVRLFQIVQTYYVRSRPKLRPTEAYAVYWMLLLYFMLIWTFSVPIRWQFLLFQVAQVSNRRKRKSVITYIYIHMCVLCVVCVCVCVFIYGLYTPSPSLLICNKITFSRRVYICLFVSFLIKAFGF